MYSAYSIRPNLILGFHGCDKTIAQEVVSRKRDLDKSENKYDWLGHGIYFWENNYKRAYDWAVNRKEKPQVNNDEKHNIDDPAVVGAVINLGNCLDLFDSASFELIKSAYQYYLKMLAKADKKIPTNKGGKENVLRNLDCAVLLALQELRKDENEEPFDSVRGAFREGEPIYENSGFRDKNHIQICIINPNCIKGYFLPREVSKSHKRV